MLSYSDWSKATLVGFVKLKMSCSHKTIKKPLNDIIAEHLSQLELLATSIHSYAGLDDECKQTLFDRYQS